VKSGAGDIEADGNGATPGALAVVRSAMRTAGTRCEGVSTLSILLAIGAMLFLYVFVFSPWFIPVFIGQGDVLLYAAPAQRMLQGEMIYRDFFEFVPPGFALVYLFFFRLFGMQSWIPNLQVLLLGGSLVWLGAEISRKMMRPALALLPSALFLVDVRLYISDPTHHWYSSLAALAGIAVLFERRTPTRVIAAGFVCGLGACFTQTRGLAAVVGIAVFLWWESRQRKKEKRELLKKWARLAAGFAAALVLVNGYFIWEAGPARFFWCTVAFLLKYYPRQANWNTWRCMTPYWDLLLAAPHSLHSTFVAAKLLPDLAGVPIVLILFFVRYWKQAGWKSRDLWERPMLVAIVGLFCFLSVAPAPAPNRVMSGALPAFILLGWFLDSPKKPARSLVVIWGVLTLACVSYSMIRFRPTVIGELTTSTGRVAFSNGDAPAYQEYLWVQEHARAGEYFYDAGSPDMNFYLGLRNPTPNPRVVNNGYTTPRQVADVIQGLEIHPTKYILWASGDLDPIPDWENPSDAHLAPLRDYIHSRYTLAKVFDGPDGEDEIWERLAQ
jgi:hypothetical protein